MTEDRKFDNAERADLLCFLVLAQLIGHATTGNWLRTGHIGVAARMWAASNSADCDWLDRAKLARMSAHLAPQFLTFPWFMDPARMVAMFVDGWRLDYRNMQNLPPSINIPVTQNWNGNSKSSRKR